MVRIIPYIMENKRCLKPPTRNPETRLFGGHSLTNHDSSEGSEVVMNFTQIDVIATFNDI
jgi:hypothetical protein